MLMSNSSFEQKLLKTVKLLSVATAGVAIVGSLPKPVQAFVLDGNAGSIQFAVAPLGGANFGGATFAPSGLLISAGGGYPNLGAPIGNIQVSNGPISPPLAAVANPAGIDNGRFGSGNDVLFGIAFPNGAAIVWPSFSVSDAVADGNASVNASSANATFINNAFQPFVGTGGAFLAVRGNVGAGGLVEASLAGTIGGVAFQPIVIAASNGRGLNNFVSAGTFQRFTPTGGGTFNAAGVSIIPGLFTVNPGQAINLQGTLSLVADPDGSLDPGQLPSDAPVPDLGPTVVEQVPEPSSVLGTLAFGVLGLGLLLKRQLKKPKVLV